MQVRKQGKTKDSESVTLHEQYQCLYFLIPCSAELWIRSMEVHKDLMMWSQ